MRRKTEADLAAMSDAEIFTYFMEGMIATRVMISLLEKSTEKMTELPAAAYAGVQKLAQSMETLKTKMEAKGTTGADLFERCYGEEYQVVLRLLTDKKPTKNLPSA
jgi:hypothetical protein